MAHLELWCSLFFVSKMTWASFRGATEAEDVVAR